MERIEFEDQCKDDLMRAAIWLWEKSLPDQCMTILNILISEEHRDAYVLAGHCMSENETANSKRLASAFYEIACDMGDEVGCYNLYLLHKDDDQNLANQYREKAISLGWTDF